jgi:PAS domain S-box-containing protein
MTGHGEVPVAVRAMKLGAVDFLEKPFEEGVLIGSLDRAFQLLKDRGEKAGRKRQALDRVAVLTAREHEVLRGLMAGMPNKMLARQLDISLRTVEMHRANMMADLGIDSLPEALRLAIDAELPPLAPEGAAEAAPTLRPPAHRPPPARAERREYEEKPRLVLEASSDGAWVWTIPTNELSLSARLVERFGYRPEDAPDRFDLLADFIHPEDWPGFCTELESHLGGRTESFVCEFRVRRGDGSWAWVFDTGSIVDRDPATGAALRMAGSISDITPRKLGEDKAREARELLELALWGAGAGVWEYDVASQMIRLSPRSRALHGMAPDGPELVSEEEWAAALHPDDLPGARAALAHAIASGERCSARFRTAARDGGWRWLIALGKAVDEGEGAPRRIVGLNQEAVGGDGTAFALRAARG